MNQTFTQNSSLTGFVLYKQQQITTFNFPQNTPQAATNDFKSPSTSGLQRGSTCKSNRVLNQSGNSRTLMSARSSQRKQVQGSVDKFCLSNTQSGASHQITLNLAKNELTKTKIPASQQSFFQSKSPAMQVEVKAKQSLRVQQGTLSPHNPNKKRPQSGIVDRKKILQTSNDLIQDVAVQIRPHRLQKQLLQNHSVESMNALDTPQQQTSNKRPISSKQGKVVNNRLTYTQASIPASSRRPQTGRPQQLKNILLSQSNAANTRNSSSTAINQKLQANSSLRASLDSQQNKASFPVQLSQRSRRAGGGFHRLQHSTYHLNVAPNQQKEPQFALQPTTTEETPSRRLKQVFRRRRRDKTCKNYHSPVDQQSQESLGNSPDQMQTHLPMKPRIIRQQVPELVELAKDQNFIQAIAGQMSQLKQDESLQLSLLNNKKSPRGTSQMLKTAQRSAKRNSPERRQLGSRYQTKIQISVPHITAPHAF